LAKLDLLNLTLTQQKRQAVAALNFIKITQEKSEKAFTIDDLYTNVVKALTDDLFMDSSALLRINFKTRKISLLASSGLRTNLKYLKLDENVSKQEILEPTLVNSKSSPQSFHTFVINSFQFPYFVWYPITDEEDGTLILFVGNRIEDLMSKQPFSQASLETFGAISSVILLRRDNIVKTQEMLRRKEERIDFLAEISKTSPISVIATDVNARVTYCNQATEKLYGYKAEELIGKDPGMLNAEHNADEIQKGIKDAVRQRKIWRGELLNKKKNGDLFYMHASIFPVLDKDGNFIAFVGFQEDVTERKRAEDERKRLLEQVRESQEQLQSLSRRLLEVQDAERCDLAHELHDQIGQNLTALGINLNIMHSQLLEQLDQKTTARLEDSMKLVEETIESIRNMLVELRPPVLDDYGLLVALRWYSERFSGRARVSIILQGEESISRLPPAVEMALFRIFQEALTNVAKHARASQVNVTLKEVNRMVQLTISDDGVGFDSTDRRLREKPGWGLITIEERAKALCGNVYVKSTPGKGTQVIVRLPC
jgi:PAS domain S-box-containing protein